MEAIKAHLEEHDKPNSWRKCEMNRRRGQEWGRQSNWGRRRKVKRWLSDSSDMLSRRLRHCAIASSRAPLSAVSSCSLKRPMGMTSKLWNKTFQIFGCYGRNLVVEACLPSCQFFVTLSRSISGLGCTTRNAIPCHIQRLRGVVKIFNLPWTFSILRDSFRFDKEVSLWSKKFPFWHMSFRFARESFQSDSA
jgi:hypothetical protein